jgi:quercetin dioxygenase-like cupin family protein
LARLAGGGLDFHRYGNHLVVILSGTVVLTPRGGAAMSLVPGDVLSCDVRTPGALRAHWDDDLWVLLIGTPDWVPDEGEREVVRGWEPRRGRPSMAWIYDDGDYSRTEPFRWPGALTTVPEPGEWPASVGAFVTRRDYGRDGFVPGVWHNGPRRQFAVTLNGRAELETSDGTVITPVAGDLVLIDDAVGPGHVTNGQGDRWMLFLTVAPGALPAVGER